MAELAWPETSYCNICRFQSNQTHHQGYTALGKWREELTINGGNVDTNEDNARPRSSANPSKGFNLWLIDTHRIRVGLRVEVEGIAPFDVGN